MKSPSPPRLRDVYGFLLTGEILGLLLANLIEQGERSMMLCGAVVGAILGAVAEQLAPRIDSAHRFRAVMFWLLFPPLSLFLYYCIMFGPACWGCSERHGRIAPKIYWPIGYVAAKNYPGPLYQAIRWYVAGTHSKQPWFVWVPADRTKANVYAEFKVSPEPSK